MSWQAYASASSGFSSMSNTKSSSSTNFKKPAQLQDKTRRELNMAKVEIWICKICNKNFDTKPGLNRHYTMVHEAPKPKPVKDVPKAIVPYRVNTPSIVCRICGNDFASQSNLNRHLNTVHQKSPAKPGNTSVAVSNSTKVVQKNKTNVTINVFKPVIYKNCNKF